MWQKTTILQEGNSVCRGYTIWASMVWNPCSSRSFPLWKSTIGRFSKLKWDVLLSVPVRFALCYFSAKTHLFLFSHDIFDPFPNQPHDGRWCVIRTYDQVALCFHSGEHARKIKVSVTKEKAPAELFCAAKKTSRRGKKTRWSWFFTNSIHRFFFFWDRRINVIREK